MKHTKKPWRISRNKEGKPVHIMSEGEATGFIAMIPFEHEHAEGNARLIAAAPELLSNLENLLAAIEAGVSTQIMIDCSSKENSYIAQAKAAINKAIGG